MVKVTLRALPQTMITTHTSTAPTLPTNIAAMSVSIPPANLTTVVVTAGITIAAIMAMNAIR